MGNVRNLRRKVSHKLYLLIIISLENDVSSTNDGTAFAKVSRWPIPQIQFEANVVLIIQFVSTRAQVDYGSAWVNSPGYLESR